jgi:hypothetical protein
LEADRFGGGLDRFLLADEEVPASRVALAVEGVDDGVLFVGGDLNGVGRVEADDDDVEVFAGFEVDRLQHLGHAVKDHVAEARAAVVGEDEDGRLAVHALGDGGFLAVGVGELGVHVDLVVEPLVELHLLDGDRVGRHQHGGEFFVGASAEGGDVKRER